jgi:hypothetical protein
VDERFLKARVLARAIRKSPQGVTLMRDPNIVGSAVGRRTASGQLTEEPALVVYVMKKVPTPFLPNSRILPRRLYVGRDYLDVDVLETGPFYPLSFTARERPAPSGISVGHPAITAGTLGCLVSDNTDNSLCILSNNHVIANQNAASIGDAIIQPGTADGGSSPADDIADLKRFVTIGATGNTVDGAIAQVRKNGDVVAQMKNNLMPYPSPDHPAVGLLFAGSCNRTIMNPIRDVLTQLNISFLAGGGSIVGPDIGMNVEKVGRTTEYTSSTILEIDATVNIPYDFGTATFDDQIVTAWMSDGGDSGSLVCRGGSGGNEDHCGCLSTAAASETLSLDLRADADLEKSFRQKYLSRSLTGRYLIDLFFANETMFIERTRAAKLSQADRDQARVLHDRYVETARQIMLSPQRSNQRLTAQHLSDARAALNRAARFLTKEEKQAADRLFQLATKMKGKTPAEILGALNENATYKEVVTTVSRVPTLRLPSEPEPPTRPVPGPGGPVPSVKRPRRKPANR